MLFSSNVFLFIYLPAVLLIDYTLKFSRRAQNVFLCLASLLFYAWGEPRFVLVMMASILVNWFFGLLVGTFKEYKNVRWLIALDVFINLLIIFIYKYLAFTVKNLNLVFRVHWKVPEIALPIGISFFTFQAISYVIDVYRGRGEAQRNLLNVGLYISFFPQLIAGPIVRYETIADQINNRKENLQDFSDGVVRFIIGLGKKVLLANNMALIADHAFGFGNGTIQWFGAEIPLTAGMAWLGALAYTFQIYFDFSGYSDMAIGLGKMFGFHFDGNFNYPYISRSVTEFWRRWHISLSSWFRDYVYIPLGGNRVKTEARHIFNLFVVWLLTGIWHGANWTFILWGLTYFVLLVTEKRLGLHKEAKYRWLNPLKYIITMFFVIMEWVLFRADSLGDAIHYMSCMFGADGWGLSNPGIFYLTQYRYFWLAAIVGSLPWVPWLGKRLKQEGVSAKRKWAADVISGVFIVGILLVSVSYIVIGSYNPFIYFNF